MIPKESRADIAFFFIWTLFIACVLAFSLGASKSEADTDPHYVITRHIDGITVYLHWESGAPSWSPLVVDAVHFDRQSAREAAETFDGWMTPAKDDK